MDKATKYKLARNVLCEDCETDNEIQCPRDRDLKCLKCGKELCAYHMGKHLKEHSISVDWKGL